jgi:hypothetical protein
MLSIVMLSVIWKSVTRHSLAMLSVVMLRMSIRVFLLTVIRLSVFLLTAFRLNVVACRLRFANVFSHLICPLNLSVFCYQIFYPNIENLKEIKRFSMRAS